MKKWEKSEIRDRECKEQGLKVGPKWPLLNAWRRWEGCKSTKCPTWNVKSCKNVVDNVFKCYGQDSKDTPSNKDRAATNQISQRHIALSCWQKCPKNGEKTKAEKGGRGKRNKEIINCRCTLWRGVEKGGMKAGIKEVKQTAAIPLWR